MTTKEIAAPKDLRGMIALPETRQQFESILGGKSRAFAASVLELYNSESSLQDCDPRSILASAKMAAVLDLPIVKSLGQACIVAYSGKAQFQIMARGFIQLALRSGQYKTAHDAIVYEGELKSRNRLTGELEFDPAGKKSEKIVGFLFYFRLLNGFEKYTFMTVDECHAHGKKYSRSYGSDKGKWKTDFNHMALKTVVKQGLSKWGPLSTEMQQAIEADQAAIGPDGKPEYIDAAVVDRVEAPSKPIPSPSESEITTDTFQVGEKFLARRKKGAATWIEFLGPEKDQVYVIAEATAKNVNANFKTGDTAIVEWKLDGGVKTVVEITRKAAPEPVEQGEF